MKDETAPPPGDQPLGELEPDVLERLAGVARSRSDIYRTLLAGFSEPNKELCAALTDGAAVRTLTDAITWLGPDAQVYATGLRTLDAAAGDVPALPGLAAEYARLFTGPGHAAVPFYSSEYLDEPGPDGRRGLYGPATAAAKAAYQSEGLVPRSTLHEPGDDIATELEFLAWLCACEAQQWTDGSSDEALRVRRSSARFLREQCAGWWPAFAETVIEETRVDVYRGLAQVLAAHLAIELGYPRSSPPAPPDQP